MSKLKNDAKPKTQNLVRIKCEACDGTGKRSQVIVTDKGSSRCPECNGQGFQSILIEGRIIAVLPDVGLS